MQSFRFDALCKSNEIKIGQVLCSPKRKKLGARLCLLNLILGCQNECGGSEWLFVEYQEFKRASKHFLFFLFNFYLYLLKIGALVSKEYNAPLGGI